MGNLAIVSLIFGQAVARETLDWTLAGLGVTLFAIGHILVYFLMKGVDDK